MHETAVDRDTARKKETNMYQSAGRAQLPSLKPGKHSPWRQIADGSPRMALVGSLTKSQHRQERQQDDHAG